MPLLCATLRNFYELPTSVVDVGSYNMTITVKISFKISVNARRYSKL